MASRPIPTSRHTTSTKLKFLVDMPVTPQAVAHLEAKGHDALHCSTAGLATEDDSVILELVAAYLSRTDPRLTSQARRLP
jgi:hypothetical protein